MLYNLRTFIIASSLAYANYETVMFSFYLFLLLYFIAYSLQPSALFARSKVKATRPIFAQTYFYNIIAVGLVFERI